MISATIKVKSPARILNKAGKERRSVGKVLNLATCYGMSGRTAGIRLGYEGKTAKEKGEELLNSFFGGFPEVKTAIDQSKEFLKKTGYVEDFIGRRRRLDDINLPPYTVTLTDKNEADTFNPFIICQNRTDKDPRVIKWENEVTQKIEASQRWQRDKAIKAGKTWEDNGEMSNKAYEELSKEARKDGVTIQANTGRIAQASRQCFNARIQGSAASLTKMAMIDIFNDPQLNAWDAHLIITVHDEVLVECPEEYADLVEKRLPEIMVAAAKKGGDDVQQACDPYNVSRWYCDTAGAFMQEEFKKLEKGDKAKGIEPLSRDAALRQLIANHSEVPEAAIIKTIETGCDLEF